MASQPLLLVGVVVLCLGLLLHIIGMATPEWSVGDAIVTVNTTGMPPTTQGTGTTSKPVNSAQSPNLKCPKGDADLVMVLDFKAGTLHTFVNSVRRAAKVAVTSMTTCSNDNIHVGLVTDANWVELTNNTGTVLRRLADESSDYVAGTLETSSLLNTVKDTIFQEDNGDRLDAENIAIIITNDGRDTSNVKGILPNTTTVYVVTIGPTAEGRFDDIAANYEIFSLTKLKQLPNKVKAVVEKILDHIEETATNTPDAMVTTNTTTEAHEYGPWKECVPGCEQVETGRAGDYDAVRFMTMVGVLCGITSVVVSVIMVFAQKDNTWVPMLAGGAGIGAFVLILLGCIIWGASVHDDLNDSFDIGYSFALSLVGGMLFGAGGVLAFCGGRDDVQ